MRTPTTIEAKILAAAAVHRYGRLDLTAVPRHLDAGRLRAGLHAAGWAATAGSIPDPDGVLPHDVITNAGRYAALRPDTIVQAGVVAGRAEDCGCVGNVIDVHGDIATVQYAAVCREHRTALRDVASLGLEAARMLTVDSCVPPLCLPGRWYAAGKAPASCRHADGRRAHLPHHCADPALAAAAIPYALTAAAAAELGQVYGCLRATEDAAKPSLVLSEVIDGHRVYVVESVTGAPNGPLRRGYEWQAVTGDFDLEPARYDQDAQRWQPGGAVGGRLLATSTESARAALSAAEQELEAARLPAARRR